MSPVYRFGAFELQPDERRLLSGGRPVTLGQRAFDVLQTLVERHDRLVAKNELLDLVWPGLVVEENNLQVQISTLRKLLGPQAIATVPGRGYRFTAPLDGHADPGADAPARQSGPASPGPTPAPASSSNLPAQLAPLYGRDQDLQALGALVGEHRLVTVVGAGGIGKSRLAQAAAHALAGRFADGAWMVELAGLADPELLPNAVAQALGIAMTGHGEAAAQLAAAMAPRTLLLVLDNCEHLLDAVAALAQATLQRAPNVALLATSQEPLRVPDEQQYRVAPLAVPQAASASAAREFGALALFEARVRAVDPRFALVDENLPLAIDICRRLDGLPLAIELAAARVGTLGLRAVRDKLDARFKLLTGGARASLRRHQTLRAALEWSHNLLDAPGRAVFRRLGAFAGGFTMEMAQAVAADDTLDEWMVLDHLSALVDKSLVVAEATDPPRYRLLESARAFALEQLADGETTEVLRRHALAVQDFMQRVDGENLEGELRTDQYAALVLPQADNLRAAYAWATGESGDPRIAVSLAAHAGALIDYATECGDWLMPLQRHVEKGAIDDALAARYWRALAASNMSGHLPVAAQLEASIRARDLYRALGRPRREFGSLIQLSRWCSVQGDRAGERAALDAARALIRPDWPPEFRILLLRREGWIARTTGRLDDALALHRECIRASAATGDWRLEVIARSNLADLLWAEGPPDVAAREACDLVAEFRTRPAAAADMDIAYANAMGVLAELGRVEDASAAARAALPIMRRTQNYCIEEWAYLFWRRNQHGIAARLLGALEAGRLRTVSAGQNEERIVARVRAALEEALPPEALAREFASGAELSRADLPALLAQALERLPREGD